MSLASPPSTGGPSLGELRRRIDALADPDGRFRVAAVATGCRPVPVDGRTFPTRAAAEVAAGLASAYRARLRRRDHRTPAYELVVHEGPVGVVRPTDRAALRCGYNPGGREHDR